ncbi:MAG: DNA repair protein RadC [Pseudomonadota bacterium]
MASDSGGYRLEDGVMASFEGALQQGAQPLPEPPPLDPNDIPTAYPREDFRSRPANTYRRLEQGRPHYWGHRERVRQRFAKGGADGLPDYELVEMILFNAVPRVDVKPLAKQLLEDFRSFERLMTASREALQRHPAIDEKICHQLKLGEAVAQRLAKARVVERPVLGGTQAVIDYFRTTMGHLDVEEFRAVFLDNQNRLIADEAQGRGTVNHTPAYPREVARRALEHNATRVVLVHNHPSGDPTPSRQDFAMTEQMQLALKSIEVALLDHIIIGAQTETSFAALGAI